MAISFFEEIIFPPIEKTIVIKSAIKNYIPIYTTKDAFELLYCDSKKAWVSLSECLNCPAANRPFEDIIEDMMGCV